MKYSSESSLNICKILKTLNQVAEWNIAVKADSTSAKYWSLNHVAEWNIAVKGDSTSAK